MSYPHGKNLQGKINKAHRNSNRFRVLSQLKIHYQTFRSHMLAINYVNRSLQDFNQAAQYIDAYLTRVDNVVNNLKLNSQDKLRSSVLEEVCVYLFENHPSIVNGTLRIYNKKIYAGVVVNRNLNYTLQTKDVDFCIGRESTLSIDNIPCNVKFPFVCVEVKTYLDATMNHDVLFSGTQIKAASPEAKTYVLMEFEDEISPRHPIPASYAYAIDRKFNLRDSKRQDPPSTPIVGEHLLNYYIEIDNALH